MRFRTLIVAALVFLCGVCAPAAADEWRAARVWIAGNDDSVWVLGESAEPAGRLPVIQMWFAGGKTAKDSKPQQTNKLPPVAGKLLFSGADAAALRVLYSDLSAYDYFGDQPSALGPVWREQCGDHPPLAWAGDNAGPSFWALVETQVLRSPTTQPGAEDQEAPALAASLPAKGDSLDRLTLLQLRDGLWSRWPVLPEAALGQRFWLAARQGALHLFWESRAQGVVTATFDREVWGGMEVVTAWKNLSAGWVGVGSDGPAFVAGLDDGSDKVAVRLFLRRDGAWSDMGVARDGTEPLGINPAVAGVAIVRGQLGIARPTPNGEVEFGLGDLGASPSIRFTTLAPGDTTPAERPLWEDALLLGVLMIVLTWVFWSRREKLAQRAHVPPGRTIAAVHRRVLATILDYLPATVIAFVIATPWLIPRMAELPPTLDWTALQERMETPEFKAVLEPMQYGTIFLYGLWCMIWELATGTTPGKMLFKCQVLGIDGNRPRPRQIVIRNAARVVEFLLGPPVWVLTLMSMAVATRNRQRIGDLLADTIVVAPGEAPKDGEQDKTDDSAPEA